MNGLAHNKLQYPKTTNVRAEAQEGLEAFLFFLFFVPALGFSVIVCKDVS